MISHIDMNSYFASVEQQANPFLRGRSVGVCAYLSENGCIIASSREAKEKGVKTGCRVKDARVLDPQIVLLENEPAKYRTVTKAILKIFNKYTSHVEPYSIDEAFLDFSGLLKTWEQVEKTTEEIRARIKDEVGEWLDCSIGISWTKFLAKFACDISPKQKTLLINNQTVLREVVKGRALTDAWGINVRTEARLKQLGISNLGELRESDPQKLRNLLGKQGYYLWANLNGQEINQVNLGTKKAKSIGHSYCLPKKTTDKEYLRPILYKLCERTGRRLRDSDQEAEGLRIVLAYTSGGGISRSFKTAEKLFTTAEIFSEASRILEQNDLLDSVRLIAVSVFRLSPMSKQMSLLDDNLKEKDLSRALDSLNKKYGEFTVIKGQMFGTDKQAQDRIGFRKID